MKEYSIFTQSQLVSFHLEFIDPDELLMIRAYHGWGDDKFQLDSVLKVREIMSQTSLKKAVCLCSRFNTVSHYLVTSDDCSTGVNDLKIANEITRTLDELSVLSDWDTRSKPTVLVTGGNRAVVNMDQLLLRLPKAQGICAVPVLKQECKSAQNKLQVT